MPLPMSSGFVAVLVAEELRLAPDHELLADAREQLAVEHLELEVALRRTRAPAGSRRGSTAAGLRSSAGRGRRRPCGACREVLRARRLEHDAVGTGARAGRNLHASLPYKPQVARHRGGSLGPARAARGRSGSRVEHICTARAPGAAALVFTSMQSPSALMPMSIALGLPPFASTGQPRSSAASVTSVPWRRRCRRRSACWTCRQSPALQPCRLTKLGL